MNKKGKAMSVFLVIIGSLMVIGMFTGLGVWYQQGTAIAEAEEITPIEKKEAGSIAFCSNNPDLDLEVQAKDMLTDAGNYRAGQIYLQDVTDDNEDGVSDTGIISEHDLTSTTSARTDLTDVLLCNHEYDLWTKSSPAGNSESGNYSAFREAVKIGRADTLQDPVRVDLNVERSTSWLRVRAKDNLIGEYMYNADTGATASSYVPINSNGTTDTNFSSTVDATNMALANGEEFDVTFSIRTNSSDMKFGLDVIYALDYSDDTDTSDWQSAEFKVSLDGVAVSEYTPSLNDREALAGYEKFYLLSGGFDEDESLLRVTGKTSDSATVDRDLTHRFVGTGTFLDDKNPRNLLQGVGFQTNGATRTSIVTSEVLVVRNLID